MIFEELSNWLESVVDGIFAVKIFPMPSDYVAIKLL